MNIRILLRNNILNSLLSRFILHLFVIIGILFGFENSDILFLEIFKTVACVQCFMRVWILKHDIENFSALIIRISFYNFDYSLHKIWCPFVIINIRSRILLILGWHWFLGREVYYRESVHKIYWFLMYRIMGKVCRTDIFIIYKFDYILDKLLASCNFVIFILYISSAAIIND